jgi:hypothetical protein
MVGGLTEFCIGWVLTVAASSRNSSPISRKRCLIVIEDFGWPTRRMNYILTMALTRHNVSIFQTPRHLQSQTFLEAHSLNWYRFIGRILGKALYEGILVEVAFAGFFLAKVRLCHLIASPRGCLLCRPYQWLGKQSFLDDLASLDPDLYQGLIFLKHYPGNPEELSLNFTIVRISQSSTKVGLVLN